MNVAKLDWRRIGTIAVAVVFLVVFAAILVAAVPQVAGADHSYVVLSDSMSPSISAGSIVVVSETSAQQLETGDVITYVGQGDTRITHRVVEIQTRDGEPEFRTKGDANDNPDDQLVAAGDVIGAVQFHIPLVGYVINFAQSTVGILTLLVLPAILLAGSEVHTLYRDLQNGGESDP